jgi:hypothetical protein
MHDVHPDKLGLVMRSKQVRVGLGITMTLGKTLYRLANWAWINAKIALIVEKLIRRLIFCEDLFSSECNFTVSETETVMASEIRYCFLQTLKQWFVSRGVVWTHFEMTKKSVSISIDDLWQTARQLP